jgi:SAM-dependent methyltransferase
MNKKILFVSHRKAQCGVYEFGKNITNILSDSKKYDFIRVECSSLGELKDAINKNNPSAIIYNYIPPVLPWIATRVAKIFYRNNIKSIEITQVGIIHEVTQRVADLATGYRKKFIFGRTKRLYNSLFDFYIAPDPTLFLRNDLVYKTGRLIQPYQNIFPIPQKTTIGSFGFATRGKGFERIVQLVQQEFDEAIIKFNIPAADFGDRNGANAKDVAERCRTMITKPGIELVISHDFLDNKAILDFLAKNTINVFLYEDMGDRGLSSVIDMAMAVQRPIAVSDSVMFRHILDVEPSICIAKNDLRTIIKNGFEPLKKHFDEWNAENLLWDYERILDSIFEKKQQPLKSQRSFARRIYSIWKKFLLKPDRTSIWLRNSEEMAKDDMNVVGNPYYPVQVSDDISLNRILDNRARDLYKPAIDKITELVPKTIAKKIPEANVQQAFVFDTVQRYIPHYKNPKVLCVGSYEDTASMGLIKMGVKVEEIDPMLNYSLQEYFTKPTTLKSSYDIIFSTSVIEHDPNDESFIKCIDGLLAPAGIFIMTCDYKEGWMPGDSKPDVDMRFYTQKDLRDRLLPLMRDCDLIDEPQWNCPNPDFNLSGKYQYTFATLVVKKKINYA